MYSFIRRGILLYFLPFGEGSTDVHAASTYIDVSPFIMVFWSLFFSRFLWEQYFLTFCVLITVCPWLLYLEVSLAAYKIIGSHFLSLSIWNMLLQLFLFLFLKHCFNKSDRSLISFPFTWPGQICYMRPWSFYSFYGKLIFLNFSRKSVLWYLSQLYSTRVLSFVFMKCTYMCTYMYIYYNNLILSEISWFYFLFPLLSEFHISYTLDQFLYLVIW